jgi:DNA-binding MarR family transcriptional regulator
MHAREKVYLKHSEVIKPFSDGDRDFDFWLLLSRARYAFYRARDLELSRYGLTAEQAQILFIIHCSKGKITPAAIAREAFRQPHSISSIVNRMERAGLLEKAMDTDHRNQVRISMTEKGEKAYEHSAKRGPIHRVMKAITRDERDQLCSVLDKILIAAGNEPGLKRPCLPASD